MSVEIFVFNGNRSLFDVVGNVFACDRCAAIIGIYLIEQFSVSIEDLGTYWGGVLRQASRTRNILEKEKEVDKENATDNQQGGDHYVTFTPRQKGLDVFFDGLQSLFSSNGHGYYYIHV